MWVTTTEDCGVKVYGCEMVTCGLCSRWRKLPHVYILAVSAGALEVLLQ